MATCSIFQSTLPAWGATYCAREISMAFPYFNPRSPRGERPSRRHTGTAATQNFNPRSPRGERRLACRELCYLFDFNPRSPRGERLRRIRPRPGRHDFNPRSPRGERLRRARCLERLDVISIHAPRVGSDATASSGAGELTKISIHAPRVGSDSSFSPL